ncbi:hypothetical protein HDV05_004772 [Chytridiales sp. JEL 0842]|nr:hypothetical protein HDV05_004772 [Chytridiales sp. JEL 0842]
MDIPTHHRYFLVRHGQSKANVSKTIVSDPQLGVKPEQGLTAEGIYQVTKAAAEFCNILESEMTASGSSQKISIITSDFSRAHETANILAQHLQKLMPANPELSISLSVDTRLRERSFGPKYEGKSSELYEEIWEMDKLEQSAAGVETPPEVLRRALQLVIECERTIRHSRPPHIVIFVGHGDTLQVKSLTL